MIIVLVQRFHEYNIIHVDAPNHIPILMHFPNEQSFIQNLSNHKTIQSNKSAPALTLHRSDVWSMSVALEPKNRLVLNTQSSILVRAHFSGIHSRSNHLFLRYFKPKPNVTVVISFACGANWKIIESNFWLLLAKYCLAWMCWWYHWNHGREWIDKSMNHFVGDNVMRIHQSI